MGEKGEGRGRRGHFSGVLSKGRRRAVSWLTYSELKKGYIIPGPRRVEEERRKAREEFQVKEE